MRTASRAAEALRRGPGHARGAGPVWFSAVVFLAGVVWAGGAAVWVWPRSMVSDLGAVGCLVTDHRYVCSPRHAAFNAAMVLSGVAMAAGAWWLRPVGGRWARLGIGCAGAGLVTLGIFPADTAHAAHMVGAVLALPVSAALLLVGSSTSSGPCRGLRRALAAASLAGNLAHLFPEWDARGVAELCSLVALWAVILLEASLTDSGSEVAQGGPGSLPASDGRTAAEHR